jgi:hypothetical protein
MTHRAVGFGRGFPRAWLIPISALTIVLGIAASGRLSRSIVADLIAWWPVWLGLGVAAYLLRERKVGSFRVAGIVPLVALGFVLLFIWGHLAGWSIMPSASQRLVGPEVGSTSIASMEGAVDGRIDVSADTDFLYQIEPIKQGGGIGIPTASEQVNGSTVAVRLEAPAEAGLYGYAGWDMRLSPIPNWDLRLDGALDADLAEVSVSALSVGGAGTVILGEATSAVPVQVSGSYLIVVPEDAPARVEGVASVPSSWTPTSAGATSPAGTGGWVITVVGDANVTVQHP